MTLIWQACQELFASTRNWCYRWRNESQGADAGNKQTGWRRSGFVSIPGPTYPDRPQSGFQALETSSGQAQERRQIAYVKLRHIETGQPRRITLCPIALAFLELTGARVHVGLVELETRGETYYLPLSAQRFIAHFDSGKPVKPFAFLLK